MSNKTPRPSSLYGSSNKPSAPPVPRRKESLPTPSHQSKPALSADFAAPLALPETPTSAPYSISAPKEEIKLRFGPVLYAPASRLLRTMSTVEPMITEFSPASTSSSVSSVAASPSSVSSSAPSGVSCVFEAKDLYKESFKVLYDFYQSGELCDVEIQVGRRGIKCHRVVLACVSRYFRSMFSSEMVESRKPVIPIKDIEEIAMKQLIEFAYTAKISINIEIVQSLLYAASILQVEAVAIACCDFMKNHLHPSNCIGVRNFAEQHGRTELVRKTDQFVLANFSSVRESDEYQSINAKYLENLISSTDLNVKDEVEVYEAVIKWVKYDVNERKKDLPRLLHNVRLPLLPAEYLVQTVCKDDLIRTDLGCRDLIDEAKLYHMSMTHVMPDLSTSTKVFPRKSCAGVIFCVGGRGSSGDPFKSIECYDLRRDRWFPVADMSSKRRHVGVVAAEGKLYAIGGHDGTDHLSSGELFDPHENKWKPIAAMTTLRRGLAVASLPNGPIYALGGLDDATCYNIVERYDPESNSWNFVQAMNVPRGGVAVAAIKGQLYAVGGNDGAASLDSCEKYDPHLNKWTLMANMNKRRAGAGCAELGGILYVVGGFDDNAPLDSVEKYDPTNNKWTMISKMSCPRGGVGVAALGGKIYAVGGHDGTNYLNTVEAYDPISHSWCAIGSISACRAGAGVAFCNSNIRDIVDNLRSSELLMSSPKVTSCV